MKGEYSAEESCMKIKQLRDRLDDVITKDEKYTNEFYLHRWLIQHNFKVDQAEQAIRESVEWRKENDIEILGEEEWGFGVAGLLKDFPVCSEGVSKSGQAIFAVNGENVDFRTLIKKYGKATLLRYNIQLYVKLEKLLIQTYNKKLNCGENKTNSETETGTGTGNDVDVDSSSILENSNLAPIIISNYKNLSVWNATSLDVIWVLVEGAKIGVKYFPCLVSAVDIINTNKFSALLFKTVKPIFATSPYYTVECYDTDKAKWSKVLLERIDASQLTPRFGGTKIDPSDSDSC